MVVEAVAEQRFASLTVTVYVPAGFTVIPAEVAPPGAHVYVSVPVPPEPVAVAVPLVPPKQLTGVFTTLTATADEGPPIVVDAVAEQRLASLTVTVYVPAGLPVRPGVVAPPGLHVYVSVPVPPLPVAVVVPVLPPKQVTGVDVALAETAVAGCVIAPLAVAVQLPSVTVTVYVPAALFEIVAVVPPPGLHK
jgi:hypothetical protein